MEASSTMSTLLCKNCSSPHHLYKQCRHPVLSMGLIVARPRPHHEVADADAASSTASDKVDLFMVRRRHTLGYFDFVRGNYEVPDTAMKTAHLVKMLRQITVTERDQLLYWTFDALWEDLWNQNRRSLQKYYHEKVSSQSRFDQLRTTGWEGNGEPTTWLQHIFDLCGQEGAKKGESWPWTEPEWGFPKGRRNQNEDDETCALREFLEETQWFVSKDELKQWIVQDEVPLEESFLGSNLRAYTHRYFVALVPYKESLEYSLDAVWDASEISLSAWMPLSESLTLVRSYNLEKKQVICQVRELVERCL